ncbi:trehalose-phosphatase [Celeribacter indicus]|uniref:Trehalose 6-phosphate phosphatase n=1 Tax=Celeribacter indicus TaxID=1208324 RepID=A0A0B5E7P8_9RHOB|nr:trehalose-phosphatase [Celeribacter indicus]AJE49081.1 trehalose-phosphatase [Celeribacter indicus]SDW45390.1 trehalose 6-phosphatase [Celeribacter indicus]
MPDLPCHPPLPLAWGNHALFLDFDGVVAPIVSRPEDVVVAPETLRLVEALIERTEGAVAMISGRALENLRSVTGDPAVWMSGSHGLEIKRADGTVEETAPGAALTAPHDTLADFAARHDLLLERKPGALALHYRGRDDLEAACRGAVDSAAASEGLRALHGNKVSEVALAGVDKGTALRRLMEEAPFRDRIPVMIGDDVTDEDGFVAAQDLGGFGLRIGTVETAARYRVDRMQQAHDWLRATLSD